LTITDLPAPFDRVRDDGVQDYSIVDEELERGLPSIAVPLVGRGGELIAGLKHPFDADHAQ
jgi:DNA-binding IclR family transcriptional regulator